MDIRQSSSYASYLRKINWQAKKLDKWNIFIKKIPLLGNFAKLQKITPPIPFKTIDLLIIKENIRKLVVEPDIVSKPGIVEQFVKHGYKINNSPYNPSKTILIDLVREEFEIFNSFKEAKRRSIRKAQKNKLLVIESDNIEAFIKLKTRNFFPLGFLMANEIRMLWKTFYPKNASLLLAKHRLEGVIAGILLLFYQNKAYYWLAASTNEGNKIYAPSLLVWEALKLSKKKRCAIFDFEGIYDGRFHKATKDWKGFTKFKQGFSNNETTFIGSFIKTKFPFI